MQGPARSSSLPPRPAWLTPRRCRGFAGGSRAKTRPAPCWGSPFGGGPAGESCGTAGRRIRTTGHQIAARPLGLAAVLLDIVNEGTAIGGGEGFGRSDPGGGFLPSMAFKCLLEYLRSGGNPRRRMEKPSKDRRPILPKSLGVEEVAIVVLGHAGVRSATSSAWCELGPPASYRRAEGIGRDPGGRGVFGLGWLDCV